MTNKFDGRVDDLSVRLFLCSTARGSRYAILYDEKLYSKSEFSGDLFSRLRSTLSVQIHVATTRATVRIESELTLECV